MPEIPHWLWVVWLLSGLAIIAIWGTWFGIMETIAIINGIRGDTLSEVVWQHGHVPAVVFFAGCGLLIFSLLWLMLHFVSRGKWGF